MRSSKKFPAVVAADPRPKASSSRAKAAPLAAAAIALALDGVDGHLGDVGSDCQEYRDIGLVWKLRHQRKWLQPPASGISYHF